MAGLASAFGRLLIDGRSDIVKPGIALGRYGQSTEIASVVAFLANPEVSFVTGADIVADVVSLPHPVCAPAKKLMKSECFFKEALEL
ncbi:SDR family oxidoreductase [Pseudomonas sp. FP2196]|uniref:SDR family oxidoreductase n=1 Tax=Pseudomonas sp. FP2196 TaxID=2954086 RepID=UPI00273533CF|nr:SDR family oxidoreductase [Pseudomonas sp. FP2196]WLH38007.1 SDR family oxidoreductase [Pseudomonas sp. FP2196]